MTGKNTCHKEKLLHIREFEPFVFDWSAESLVKGVRTPVNPHCCDSTNSRPPESDNGDVILGRLRLVRKPNVVIIYREQIAS